MKCSLLNCMIGSLIAMSIGFFIGMRSVAERKIDLPVITLEGPVQNAITADEGLIDLSKLYILNPGAPYGRVGLDFETEDFQFLANAENSIKIKTVTGKLISRRVLYGGDDGGDFTTELLVTDYSLEE